MGTPRLESTAETIIAVSPGMASICIPKDPATSNGATRKCYIDRGPNGQRDGVVDEIRTEYRDGSATSQPVGPQDLLQMARPLEPYLSRAARTLRDLRFAADPDVATDILRTANAAQFRVTGKAIAERIEAERARSRAFVPPMDPIPSFIWSDSAVTVATRWNADRTCTMVWVRAITGTEEINILVTDPAMIAERALTALRAVYASQPDVALQ